MESDHRTLCLLGERGKARKLLIPPNWFQVIIPNWNYFIWIYAAPFSMRVASINGKKYILVIVDDFLRIYERPELQRFNNHNSSANPMNTPSKEDLDNLFGPMFEDYFEKASCDTTHVNSAAQPTQVHEDIHLHHITQSSVDTCSAFLLTLVLLNQGISNEIANCGLWKNKCDLLKILVAIRNKTRLVVLRMIKHEEGIDFEESFAPVDQS
ncbi:hypothetical protein Tco_0608210 [Tanacetum coccineum]